MTIASQYNSQLFSLRHRGGKSLLSEGGRSKSKLSLGPHRYTSNKNNKPKLGVNSSPPCSHRHSSFFSIIKFGFTTAIVAFLLVVYFPQKYLGGGGDNFYHHGSSASAEGSFLRPPSKVDEWSASCQHLPDVYWINLNESKERRDAVMKSFKKLGIVNQHRVTAVDVQEASASINAKQLILHPKIQIYAGDENPSFWKHPDNIYTYNEAACLLSHLRAIKQAYDDGHELAFIAEDDASFSSIFCDGFASYVARAPEGWKVLQFATNNPHVIKLGSLIHEPFISWQRYHHSTRAYLINRSGMEALLGKVHSTNLAGESVWRVQEFPSVVADETMYSFIGDTYYSTGLWVDTLELQSTIQKHGPKGHWKHPYSFLQGKQREQISMKREMPPAHLIDRSVLVVMSVCISDESQISREIEVVTQDIRALCVFHRVCEWEINVVALESSLATLFEEAASGLPSNAHLHTKVHSEGAFSQFLFLRDTLSKLAAFDLVLFKENDQRINGFPWRAFVEHTDNAVLSAPLRSTQKDHMLFNTKEKKSQEVLFHDANHWLFWNNGRDWHRNMFQKFENIKPVEVPFLETYFVLMDATFAKQFFERATALDILDHAPIHHLWCKAAFDWDSSRPSCSLIPLVSTHEDSLNAGKRHAFSLDDSSENTAPFAASKTVGPAFDKWTSIALEWEAIVGKQHTVLEMEQLCSKKMDTPFVDADDDAAYEGVPEVFIGDCASIFIQEFSSSSSGAQHFFSSSVLQEETKAVETNHERGRVAAPTSISRLEFVHITKTGGSAIEHAGAAAGINWGACHYMEIEEVGCTSPDLSYEAPDYQSYALTSPWHTPPKLLKAYVDGSLNPYNEADLFTVVRNPYSRVVSEYYCPWNGFQPKYRRGTVHEKDPNDPKVMNEWIKSMVKRLGSAMDEFSEKNPDEDNVMTQAKGVNEDEMILAQKHYINQAEYVYNGDGIIVKNVLHYENLSTDFDALMKKYKLDVTLASKDEGVNKNRLSYKDLDPEAIALVNAFAKSDFEKFGYQMVERKFEETYSLEAKRYV